MTIDANRLDTIVRDSLFRDGEDQSSAIFTEGLVRAFGFHPERLRSHDSEVAAMLAELPAPFQEGVGGGWSFLNGCEDRDGRQWGEQRDVEALMCLGVALDRVAILLPREMWSALPGGVPYFVVR